MLRQQIEMKVRIQDSVAYRVHRCARALRRHLLAMMADLDLDLTPEQWFVLNKLRQKDGQSQVELGAEIFADRPNMSRILAGMLDRGLVTRRADVEDARRHLVGLTARGRRTHDKIAKVVPGVRQAIFSGISPEDIETTMRVLERIEHNLGLEG